MKKLMSVAALALVFGFGMVAANTASATDTPDPVKLLHQMAQEEMQSAAWYDFEAKEVSRQYRVLEPVESESYFEELIEGAGAGQ